MEVRPGYKQTEVGVIPEEWDVSTVGREFSVQLGKMLDSERNVGVSKPYLGNKAVQWDRIEIGDLPTVPMSRSDLDKFRLQRGDLLVCEGGEVGRAAIWDAPIEECYYQKALHRLRPLREFEPRLMVAILRQWSMRGLLANYVTQTSIAHLPRDKFMEVPIPRPSPLEQQAIAMALSDVDALLGGLNRLIAKKRDLKQAAMQQLLTGQTRLPGFHGKWEFGNLGSVIGALDAGVSVNSVEDDDGDGFDGMFILKTSSVAGGRFIPRECKRIAPKDLCRACLNPLKGMIIISRMNTPDLVGECGYVDRDYPNLFVPDRLWMTRFKQDLHVSGLWLSYLLSTASLKRQIGAAATGTSGSMKNLSKQTFLQIPIALPSGREQSAIAAILSDMDAELSALEARSDKTRGLKQGMMQELLTGKTRLVPLGGVNA
jgi:type I restriction enzyme S subunit